MQADQHLRRLQRRTAELAQLVREFGEAIPALTEGSDATGWVLVVLGRDGLPTEIRVREGWRQRLAPERLASAVLDAHSDAVQRCTREWTNAVDDGGWWRRRADLNEESRLAGRTDPQLPSGQARDSNELAEEVLRELHSAQGPGANRSGTVEGWDDGEHVTVHLSSAGLSGCTIDPDWAQQRDGVSISTALATALQRAIAKLPASTPGGSGTGDLVGDALATLTSLTSSPDLQGGTR